MTETYIYWASHEVHYVNLCVLQMVRNNVYIAANIAVGYLGRTQFAQMDSSKLQLLTKVNILSDIYDRYHQFLEIAWERMQHVVAALAMHNRLNIPEYLNTPQVIMSMIQDIVENSMVGNKFTVQ